MDLNPNIFDIDIEQEAIRQGFGEGLVLAAQKNENIVGLCADLVDSTKMNFFKEKFPNRFFEMGITEQNMASVASGMAALGKVPFITSYAMFSPGRNWEQIRTTICYNNSNVKIIGSHAGVSVGPDGGTHQAIEDIALTRVIPRMTVIVPCDAFEARKATLAASEMVGPVYIRLGREKTPVITTSKTPFTIGKAQILFTSENSLEKKIGIIACGQLVYNAIISAKELSSKGIEVGVMNLSTIKPLDRDAIVAFAKKYGAIVTAEEHQIAGGMGSAVAELLAQEFPTPIEFVGVKDMFGQSGTPKELMEYYGMGTKDITAAAKRALERK